MSSSNGNAGIVAIKLSTIADRKESGTEFTRFKNVWNWGPISGFCAEDEFTIRKSDEKNIISKKTIFKFFNSASRFCQEKRRSKR